MRSGRNKERWVQICRGAGYFSFFLFLSSREVRGAMVSKVEALRALAAANLGARPPGNLDLRSSAAERAKLAKKAPRLIGGERGRQAT